MKVYRRIQGDLLDHSSARSIRFDSSQPLAEIATPEIPMSGIGAQGENSGVERGTKPELVADIVPETIPRHLLFDIPNVPTLDEFEVGTVDLRHDGKSEPGSLLYQGGRALRPLHPCIGIQPEVDSVARKMSP
jgi:hypothetical protein